MSDIKKFKGGAELQAFLDQLPAKIERNIMRSAMRDGAKVLHAEIKSNAPEDTGELRDGLKISTRAKGGKVRASVKAKGKHGFLAPWFEYGTRAHQIGGRKGQTLAFAGGVYKSVEHPGMRPRPFMRPALDTKGGEAIAAVGAGIKKRLTKQGLDASGVEFDAETDEES